MTGLPGNPVTDAGGNYHAIMSSGWSATVTPTKTGYSFTPLNRVYSNVTAPLSDQDYVATIISGVVTHGGFALSGVVMTGLPGNPVTDDSGYYNAPVPYDWSGTVTPTKTGYNFTPLSNDYNNVTTPQIDQDYIATNIYDLNSDLVIDIFDFWELASVWLTTGAGTFANINKVNDVDLEDFALLAGVIGEGISVSYMGQVTGVSYMPVENAVVTILGMPLSATTDPNGYFSISGIATSQLIEVSAPGYITETFFQINTVNDTLHFVIDLAAPLVTYGGLAGSSPDIYLKKVWDYADAMMASGKDTYGTETTPLFASVLDFSPIEVPTSMPPTVSGIRGSDRVLSGGNPMHDENFYRVLYALSHISTDNSYANDADASLLWFWDNTQSANTGLYTWGEHMSWNFYSEARNTNDSRSNTHEYFRPWILWEPWLRQSPSTFSAFAMGVWDHQIGNQTTGSFSRHADYDIHGPDTNHEYPRHGGFYISTWAQGYKETKDSEFLAAMEVMVNYYQGQQHVTTRAISTTAGSTKEWTYSCLSLAIDLTNTIPLIPAGTLADEMALMAQEIDTRFLSLPHELDDPLYPGTRGLVSTAYVANTDPYSPDRPYRDWWAQGYGDGSTANMLNMCYERYLQTGNAGYEDIILAGANYYLTSDLPAGTTYPIVLAEVIKLSLNAYRITSDTAYLDRAKFFADKAIVIFWDNGTLSLPKSTSDHNHYETITNSDSLALSLLELWMYINHPELDWHFHHIDR